MIEIRWHGRGGQGSWTVARVFGMAAALYGDKYALAFPSFGPERRGAPVLGFTKIDTEKILDRSEVQESDYVVILDETLINLDTNKGIKEDGVIIINSEDGQKYSSVFGNKRIVFIDATTIALDILGMPITNTAMMAALMAVSDLVGLDAGLNALKKEMKPSIAEKNVLVVKTAYKKTLEVCNG